MKYLILLLFIASCNNPEVYVEPQLPVTKKDTTLSLTEMSDDDIRNSGIKETERPGEKVVYISPPGPNYKITKITIDGTDYLVVSSPYGLAITQHVNKFQQDTLESMIDFKTAERVKRFLDLDKPQVINPSKISGGN